MLKNKKQLYLYGYLLSYFILNLTFLTKFPFVHSDESWLSGLTRNMFLSQSIKVTEPFFDLYPRQPHAIKIIFHGFQMLFYQLFGYSVFSFRLMSLCFAIISLFLLYKLAIKLLHNQKLSLLLTIIVSLDIQFIYAAHFARAEIVLLTFFILALNCYFSKHQNLTGLIIGLSIGIHPNSFIIALAIGGLYLYDVCYKRQAKTKLFIYIGEISGFALCFVGLSFILNPNFLSDYFNYGKQFGVDRSLLAKLLEIVNYYKKIFYQVSITYYIPNVILELIILTFLVVTNLFHHNDNSFKTLLLIFGINLGIIIVGRYNTTAIVLFFPLIYLLLFITFQNIKKQKIIYILILILTLFNSISNIIPNTNNNYQKYLDNISQYVKPSDTVLANLNSEYYFDNDKLFDYRNLYYLDANNLSFADYIKNNNIQYIIYSEELDYIYNSRPVWNVVYGNLYYYYDDMQTFLTDHTTLIANFESEYGMRIVRFQNQNWQIKIYQVIN